MRELSHQTRGPVIGACIITPAPKCGNKLPHGRWFQLVSSNEEERKHTILVALKRRTEDEIQPHQKIESRTEKLAVCTQKGSALSYNGEMKTITIDIPSIGGGQVIDRYNRGLNKYILYTPVPNRIRT